MYSLLTVPPRPGEAPVTTTPKIKPFHGTAITPLDGCVMLRPCADLDGMSSDGPSKTVEGWTRHTA